MSHLEFIVRLILSFALVGSIVMMIWFLLENARREQERQRPTITNKQRMINAIRIAIRYGQIDGGHHKAWVIDQMVRELSGDNYDEIIKESCDGEDGENTYDWDCGIAP
ncbi:MAG: hypothetical protein WA061_02825 [Microgenomates group bacterium]